MVSHTIRSGTDDPAGEHCLAIRLVKRMTPVSVLLKRGAVTGAGWGAKKIRGFGQVNALIRQV
jgi:hypothetical protein